MQEYLENRLVEYASTILQKSGQELEIAGKAQV